MRAAGVVPYDLLSLSPSLPLYFPPSGVQEGREKRRKKSVTEGREGGRDERIEVRHKGE